MRRPFLVNGYSRAKPLDVINIRFLHLPQKLTGIGRKGLYIAALSLSIDGVERQRTFSGAGNAGDDHQFVPGDNDIYILKIVLPGTLDEYGIGHDALL
jgi:hypothetical protein